MVKRRDNNLTVSHIPPQKFCVMYFSNAVSQTKWSMNPIETKQHHKRHVYYNVKAVSQMNVYHLSLMNLINKKIG